MSEKKEKISIDKKTAPETQKKIVGGVESEVIKMTEESEGVSRDKIKAKIASKEAGKDGFGQNSNNNLSGRIIKKQEEMIRKRQERFSKFSPEQQRLLRRVRQEKLGMVASAPGQNRTQTWPAGQNAEAKVAIAEG